MKKMMKLWLCMLLVLCMLVGCSDDAEKKPESTGTPTPTITVTEGAEQPSPTSTPTPTVAPGVDEEVLEQEQEAFDAYLTEFFVEYAAADSVSLHFMLQHPENYGIEIGTDLGETSESLQEFGEECVEWQKRLEEFEYDYLTASQKVNYDRMAYEFALAISAKDIIPCYSSLLSSNSNAISGIATCMTEYPLLEEKDVLEYIATLEALPAYLELVMETVLEDCKNGLCPTEYMLEASRGYAEGFTGTEKHPFVVAFETNIGEVQGLTADEKAAYVAQVEDIVVDMIVPSMKQYLVDLDSVETYVVAAEGLAHKDGGKEYYAYLAQSYTGSDMTMDEMFEYLEKKLEKTLTKYYAVLMFHSDAVDKYFEADYPYTAEEMLEQLKEKIKEHYPTIDETTYILSFLPEELQVDGVLAYFLTPQLDNPDRKVIRVNPGMTDSNVMLYSTLAHEGYPGHLYQDEFFTSLEGYHPVNALFTYLGYMEGWATMAGSNAYSWCLDDDAVAEMFNFDYNYSMTLACLVDIGVNYYGWDSDQVYEYIAEHLIDDEATAIEFHEMVVADPGIYLPYMFGYFYCSDIIEALQSDKGMSEKEAYEAFLTVGPASFDVLEKHLGVSAK